MDGSAAPHPPTPQEAAQELVKRKRIRVSFYDFVKEAWSQFEFGRPFTEGWAIGAVAEHCQAVIAGEIDDLLINIPPRMSKSTMVSVCLTPWAWIDTPTLQVLSASYSDVIATNDHVKCRRLVESAWYQTRFPHIALAEDQNTKGKFDNTLGGYRVRTSTDGSTTGQGGDLILIDDPNNANDTSDAALNATLNWWRDVLPTRVNNPLKQKRIVVQQRVHEKDISGEIMREGGPSWVKLILPMEFEERRRCVTVKLPSTGDKPWTDPRMKEGELLWPERVDKTALDKIKRPMSTYARAGQLQQRPSPGEGGIIKRKWFKTWKQARPPTVDFTILSVDTAMSEQKEAAYNAATTWGVFKAPETGTPSVILLSVWREKCEYPELRKRIQRLSRNYLDEGPLEGPPAQDGKNYRPTMVLIERKNNGISLIQELSRSEITVHGFNPDKLGDKTMRVRLVTPLLESGRVWVPGAPLSNYERLRPYADEFVEQCASFPKAESRDLVDTMTQALWRLHQSGWIWVGGDPEPMPEYTNPGGDGDGEPIYG